MSISAFPLSNNSSIPIPAPPLAPRYPAPATPPASVCTVVEFPEMVGDSDQKQDSNGKEGQRDRRNNPKEVAKSRKKDAKQNSKRKPVAALPAQGAVMEPERRRVQLVADIRNGLMRLLRNLLILQVLGVLIRLGVLQA
ncbi:hypothetical protein Moror_8403 [Moniliophthora roreri MCA 2997]|uniref:Uncharacterized protein n=2 Tax=Moniliophthora roreri TaxID=221103 RepID=V2X4Y7_MONRO|nr:hypothetical protein Moror_8403 [Moniliophthora roreri MCA 2997]